jgi:hypothetical protein
MVVCRKCGKPLKDFEADLAEALTENATLGYSTRRIRIRELTEIPTIVRCEDAFICSETFDLLKEIKKHIDPGSYSWDQIDIWMTTSPSLDPYLETDRTTMPETRPCMGSITVHSQRPDEKQAHFSIAGFWDIKEIHHNPEYWWKDFEGKNGYDKNVKGHRKFDIKEGVIIESKFNNETVKIKFRGKKPSEDVKPEKQRTS